MELLKKYGRPVFCVLLLAAFFLLYEGRLFQWQVLEGESFAEQARSDRTDAIELGGVRGQILDRDGNVLAGNRTTYELIYNALEMVASQRNATILAVIDLLEERGETWRDLLPIVRDEEGEYRFAPESEQAVADLKETLNLADYATAAQCMDELTAIYNCRGFSSEDARTVVSVRYAMTRDGFSRTNPYVIAEDVTVETVGIVSQRAGEWKGVEGRVAMARYYGEDGSLAPHIVGHVGAISAEQYAQAKEDGAAYDSKTNLSGYKWTDSLGQGGLEAAFESELRGSRGEETIYTDDNGELENTALTTQPQAGSTVYTTLDSDLQRVANLSLAKNIEGNTDAKNCNSGAVVVLDVKDFGVLASASYPTYDLNSFYEDYEKLLEDKRQPMFNKALQGRYVPGSVFKPLVALAALEEGVVTAGTTYYCDPKQGFVYGEGEGQLQQDCLCGGGMRDVYTGIARSCNSYFSSVGLDLGIRRLDAYAEYFGLGERTGVELDEDVGIMTNRQEYQERFGVSMPEGVTAQAAIGQADNMFTPLQLATYAATIANNGVRLQTHFLQKVTDYSGEEVLREYEPRVVLDAGLSGDVVGAVKQGMIGVANYGTARTVFENYPITIACKTGTAETSNTANGTEPNISFICYAPAEDPQIAVAVMLQYGNKGDWAKYVAKDILDQYFGFYTWDEDGYRYDSDGNRVDSEGKMIKSREELDEERRRREALEQSQRSESSGGNGDVVGGSRGDGDPIPLLPYTGEEGSRGGETSASPTAGPEGPYYRPSG